LYNGEEVAVKVLKAMSEEKEIEEFKKEFQIMSAIHSTFMVNFYGACLEPKICMVMEYCSRGSLYHVLNDENLDIGWEKVFVFAKDMVLGIQTLHNWKPQIVHRDLKSLNLLVTKKWQTKVADFGLSRFNTDSNLQTLVKMRGTFAYCAPEVYFGEQFGTKSDIYSIGVVIWELATRCVKGHYERPYAEFKNLQFDFQIIIQTAKKGLRPTLDPNIPQGFKDLITVLLSHEASKRPECDGILKSLEDLESQYQGNKADWDKLKGSK